MSLALVSWQELRWTPLVRQLGWRVRRESRGTIAPCRCRAWVSRYRRLNTIFERTEAHLVAFIEIAFISILSRRLVRLAIQEISA
jgi:hypothetical protein